MSKRNVVAIVVILAALLALDLTNRGLFWHFAWSVTGEEAPIAQIRGVAQWVVSQTRPQPRTASLVPIDNGGVNPYGINTFLELEVDPAKVERQAQMISEAGFAWIRQQFPWEDLEVDGRGQFTDSRNDVDGDGEPDTINAWLKYDRIVDIAEQYGLRIQARLDNPPAWSRSDPAAGTVGPPDDLQDFVNYAVAVAERYRGRIQHYQVWNEPNLGFEWGNRPVDPEGYTELLCRTYNALKAVDPNIVVLSGALAPTIDLSGFNLNDFIFLQRMYDAGAGDCFDVLSVQGYGLFSGPTDRRMRPTTVNIARSVYIRDLMVANGDAHKPIWISEAAWNFVPDEAEHPEPIEARYAYGQVTKQQAADYITQFYQRTQEEWPWIGVVNYWYFTRPDDRWRNTSPYYFRMVEPDYSEDHPTFTPLPVYDSMKQYIAAQVPTLYEGVHQVDRHWAIQHEGFPVPTEGAQFERALLANSLFFVADGTDLMVRWRGDVSALTIAQTAPSARPLYTLDPDDLTGGWNTTHISLSTLPEPRLISISAEGIFVVDSITVIDRTYENVVPLAAAVFVGVGMLVLSIVVGLRR